MNDHRSYVSKLSSCEKKAGETFRLERDSTYDLCDTGAVLGQLSNRGEAIEVEYIIYSLVVVMEMVLP